MTVRYSQSDTAIPVTAAPYMTLTRNPAARIVISIIGTSFSPKLYPIFIARYAASSTAGSTRPMMTEIPDAARNSRIDSITAALSVTAPEAIGRLFFTGWSLSFWASRRSLIM